MSTRVLIVDDSADIRESLRLILEMQEDMIVVGEAGDGQRAIALSRQLKPDVVLLDVAMPVLDGIEAARAIADLPEPPRVLMLTSALTEQTTRAALDAGAAGFLVKGLRPQALPDSVRAVADGKKVLSPDVAGTVIADALGARRAREPDRQLLAALTDRERDLARAVGMGMSNAEIANELVLSAASVKTYVSRVLDKLGLANRTQLAILAHRAGLLD